MSSRDTDLRRIEAELGVLIRRVKRVIGQRAALVHPDLQPMTFLLLSHLASAGPSRAAELSEMFTMDKGGVSRQVQALVDLGLVERQPDPEDRRAVLLAASDEGRRRLAEMMQASSERFDARLGDWNDDELGAFADHIARYNLALSLD